MKKHNSRLIDLYRLVTTPMRQWQQRKRIGRGTVPVAVLFYHRVDNTFPNPWTISEAGFEQQIDWYQENFDLVSLQECQNRIRSGFNDRPTLAITFDDGYADNCTFALPLLIERKIPVTYFVTSHHTLNDQAFPHDIERGQPLPANSADSLAALAAAGVEIGGHTRNHIDLGKVTDPNVLMDEVIASAQELEKVTRRPIKYFAFPFGQLENLNADVFHLCREHGFEGVCSAYGGMNSVGEDAFHLKRIHGDPSFARMKNWLSFDPRVLKSASFDYQSLATNPVPTDTPIVTPATRSPVVTTKESV